MTWVLFDYGVGNLHSLEKALQRAGASTRRTQDPQDLDHATVAVLPGVGAFGHVMEALADAAPVLKRRHARGAPILGICIGHQVLHSGSDESPRVQGLGILPGPVHRLPASDGKIPHMGWNSLQETRGLLEGLDGQYVYYVHSFAIAGKDALATTQYGMRFAAAEQNGETVGIQFHPEKSSGVGAQVLSRLVARWGAA